MGLLLIFSNVHLLRESWMCRYLAGTVERGRCLCVPPSLRWWEGSPGMVGCEYRAQLRGCCRSWEPLAFSVRELQRLFGDIVPLIKILSGAK